MKTRFVMSGSAMTPTGLNSASPTARVFATTPPHLDSPKLSVMIPVPLVRSRSLSVRESAWCVSVRRRARPDWVDARRQEVSPRWTTVRERRDEA